MAKAFAGAAGVYRLAESQPVMKVTCRGTNGPRPRMPNGFARRKSFGAVAR